MTKSRYLTEMMTMSAQKTSDSTPSTLSWVGGIRVRAVEALPQRVERARADVAIDDAQRSQREAEEVASPMLV